MKIVGFRCDSSELIGTGHVMRCKKLASLFIKNDYKVFFICRKQKGDLIEDLANEFEVLTLPYINKNKKEIDNEIHPWLGCSQEKDLADTLKIARNLNFLKPQIIINCAAYTNVEKAESDRESAELINSKAVFELSKWSYSPYRLQGIK